MACCCWDTWNTHRSLSNATVIVLKLRIYEIHIFELRNEELNVKKILAVNNATYAVAKRKPEYQACRDSNPDLCDTGAAL